MAKNNVRCAECEYCKEFRRVGNCRSEFTCTHPDYDYILNYFRKHNIRKMQGFLGFGNRWTNDVPLKTSPAWCPKRRNKIENQEKIVGGAKNGQADTLDI